MANSSNTPPPSDGKSQEEQDLLVALSQQLSELNERYREQGVQMESLAQAQSTLTQLLASTNSHDPARLAHEMQRQQAHQRLMNDPALNAALNDYLRLSEQYSGRMHHLSDEMRAVLAQGQLPPMQPQMPPAVPPGYGYPPPPPQQPMYPPPVPDIAPPPSAYPQQHTAAAQPPASAYPNSAPPPPQQAPRPTARQLRDTWTEVDIDEAAAEIEEQQASNNAPGEQAVPDNPPPAPQSKPRKSGSSSSGSSSSSRSGSGRRRRSRRRSSRRNGKGELVIMSAVVAGLIFISIPAFFMLTKKKPEPEFLKEEQVVESTATTADGGDAEHGSVAGWLKDDFKLFAITEYGVRTMVFENDGQFSVTMTEDIYDTKETAEATAAHLAKAYKNFVGYTGPVFVIILKDTQVFATGQSG